MPHTSMKWGSAPEARLLAGEAGREENRNRNGEQRRDVYRPGLGPRECWGAVDPGPISRESASPSIEVRQVRLA